MPTMEDHVKTFFFLQIGLLLW